jgi:hypothetical protein
MTDYLADAKELLAIADDPDTRTNADEWICQRDAGVRALVGILEELRRLNEGRDQFHREVLEVLTQAKAELCGESNYEYIDPGFRRPQDVVTCERKEGHPLDFHEGSGRRWYPENRRSSEGPSGAGATAQVVETDREPRVCRECGKPGVLVICTEEDGPLTREQWLAHHEHFYQESREYGADKNGAVAYADRQMYETFGEMPAAGPSQQEGEGR